MPINHQDQHLALRTGRVAAAIAVLWALSEYASAQSFDCRRASTAIEHAICADAVLGRLDSSLATELKSLVAAHPDESKDFVWEERRWITYRDQHCAMPSLAPGDTIATCLDSLYRDRIAYLRSLDGNAAALTQAADTAVTSTYSDRAACKTLVDRYRPLADSHPGQSPVIVLAQSRTAGFKLAAGGRALLNPPSDLVSWGKAQQPPVSISPELYESFDVDHDGGWLQKAPGLPLFVLSRSEGSAGCDTSVFFVVKNGVALPSDNPFGDSCRSRETLASLDSVPLDIRENYSSPPGMKASLEVATWQGDHFEESCVVSLSYLPYVSAKTVNPHEDRCKGTDCDAMRRAAFELVKAKVTGSLSAERLLRDLTSQQRDRYRAEATVADSEFDAGASQNLVLVPYLQHGDVYVATIGDLTIGWRDYLDQSVKFERLENGKLVQDGAFTVGVSTGILKEAQVQ